jgi:hypothetical protein
MPLLDPRHCWLTLVETPDGSQAVATLAPHCVSPCPPLRGGGAPGGCSAGVSPAETFDLDAAAALRDQVGEAAVISFIGDDAIAYCASARDLQACLAEWVEIDLSDPLIVTTNANDLKQTDPGVVTRADLLTILHEVRAAVDDAGSVVDAGEDEEVAYEHELRRLDLLIKRLAAGAELVE